MGKIIEHKLNITTIGRDRSVYVYLPFDYDVTKDEYEVVYMHDAQNVLFDEKAMGGISWGVTRNFNNKNQKQYIFVCIDHGSEYRFSEYGVVEQSMYTLRHVKKGNIPQEMQGEKYIEWLATELVPFINENYRTKKELKSTSIIGSSMGGLISLYAICQYPNVFGNAGVLSPAFWYSSNKYYDLVRKSDYVGKVYMSVGTNEEGFGTAEMYMNDALKMSIILADKGDFVFRVVKDGIHNERDWDKLMPEILNYFSE